MRKKTAFHNAVFYLVGVTGFEPATTTPPVWCATKLRYTPQKCPSIKDANHNEITRGVKPNLVAQNQQNFFELSNHLTNHLVILGVVIRHHFIRHTQPGSTNGESMVIE
jgi:hypothetical protein